MFDAYVFFSLLFTIIKDGASNQIAICEPIVGWIAKKPDFY